MGQRVNMHLNQGETDNVETGRRVRHGCGISPMLFNLHGEYTIKKALAEVGSFKVEGRIINEVRFADDRAIIAKTQEELQYMMNTLVATRRK